MSGHTVWVWGCPWSDDSSEIGFQVFEGPEAGFGDGLEPLGRTVGHWEYLGTV